MAKQLQLTIPTPCHENWNNMTLVDKGKFCGSCQKQVVDFSNMSDRQVAEFFKKPSTGSVCGRFMNDQLDRTMEIPGKRIPWVKYFFQFAIPAFLLSIKSSSAKAQGAVMVKEINKPIKHMVGEPLLTDCKKTIANDTITMPEVVVTARTRSEIVGRLVVQSVAVVNKTPEVVTCLEGKVGGVEVIVGGVGIKRSSKKKQNKTIPLLANLFKGTASISFKVFPNPVLSGSNLTIESKQLEQGYYSLQILSQSGQSVYQQEIVVDAEARLLSINVPSVSAGSYFLAMINNKSGKKHTEKIIIQ